MPIAMGSGASASDQQGQDRISRRERIERILRWAQFLPAAERFLIEQVYEHGTSVRVLASLQGCARRTMYRRVQSLVNHLEHPFFSYVAQSPEFLPRPCRSVAERVYIRGHSLRQVARDLDVPVHVVRERVGAARQVLRELARHQPMPLYTHQRLTRPQRHDPLNRKLEPTPAEPFSRVGV